MYSCYLFLISSTLFSSVQSLVVSDSLQPHGLQHDRLTCPSPTPGVFSSSCPLSQWCHPTISSSVVPSPCILNLSQHQGLFQWVGSSCIWQKYWSFSFSISLSSEYSGLISFRIDWLDLLSVQGTLKSLLQHHGFESIDSWALSLLYDPSLTSRHNYWKNHSFD